MTSAEVVQHSEVTALDGSDTGKDFFVRIHFVLSVKLREN